MKITEITEGWGEYSNKSNHRMNKFKREETDEGWGEFKSAAKAGYDAVANTSVGRALGRGATAAAAKMGSGRAQGAQKVQQATMGVMKNFQRYLGQTGSKPTVGALKQYMSALGIKDPVMEVAKGAWAGGARKGFDPSKRGAQQPKAQANKDTGGTPGMKDTDVLDKNQLMKIIQTNIQNALKTGTLPNELKKFLGQ